MTLWQRDDLKIAWRRATPAMEALRPPIFPEKEPPPLQQVFSTSLQYSESAPFLDYYEKNPIRWEQETPRLHWRHTMFVSLRVEQDQQGYWLAYRDDYPMLRDTTPARFASRANAQRAADAHELDLFPNAKAIDDGLSWLPDPEIDWGSVPHLVEERAIRQALP